MQFASLGSGSKGNATLVRTGQTCILVDCGFSMREAVTRLQRRDCDPGSISAILVTHEHGDHIRGVGPLARKYGIPVWTSRGTASGSVLGKLHEHNYLDVHEELQIGDITVHSFPVPHDAREPCQFVFQQQAGKRLGILTDTGSITAHIEEKLSACDALLLECNHDARMLADGPYPLSLKQRVASRLGHLSNDQAAELLARLDLSRLQTLVVAHLSEQNNTPHHARAALAAVLDCEPEWIQVADQAEGFDWYRI